MQRWSWQLSTETSELLCLLNSSKHFWDCHTGLHSWRFPLVELEEHFLNVGLARKALPLRLEPVEAKWCLYLGAALIDPWFLCCSTLVLGEVWERVFKMAQSTNLLDNFVTIWAVSLTHRCANLEQCGAATLTVPYSSATEASSHPNAMNLHPRSAHLSVTKLHRFLFLPVMRLISILVPLGCHVLWLHPPISWLWFVWAALCVGWLPPAGTLDLSVTELWPHTVWNVATTL